MKPTFPRPASRPAPTAPTAPTGIPSGTRQAGIALLASMMVLIMLTLLALGMFSSFTQQQKMAGNMREKERAFESAENALQFGKFWLNNASGGTGAGCTGTVIILQLSDMRVCDSALANPTDPDNWIGGVTYLPPVMQLGSTGTIVDSNGNEDINYARIPGLHVSYLGVSPGGKEMLYTVTGAGFGGSTSSTSVVQSVYAVKFSAQSLTGP